jgi:hypothetical protein
MSDNAFDMVRKIRHLPGLKVTATLDPTLVPKRVKTAAQKMLRTGVLSSGYRSKSRLLAEQMLQSFGQQAVGSATVWAVFIYEMAMLTPDAREQIVELLGAARLIEHVNSPRNDAAINDRYDRLIDDVRTIKAGRDSYYTGNKNIQLQIAMVASACRTPEHVKAHEALAARLDSPEPFAVNF